jgi:Cu-Zn family superoxide dismutase
MRYFCRLVTAAASLIAAHGVASAQQSFDINRISASGIGEKIGTATVSADADGVMLKIEVSGLPEGPHGFHLHENGDCGPAEKDGKMTAGLAAGGHYDPESHKSHQGPTGDGHKGDLPLLTATATGINETVVAPRLTMADVAGRALVIHEGGDNYTDQPENGGGGGRIACGVVPKL